MNIAEEERQLLRHGWVFEVFVYSDGIIKRMLVLNFDDIEKDDQVWLCSV